MTGVGRRRSLSLACVFVLGSSCAARGPKTVQVPLDDNVQKTAAVQQRIDNDSGGTGGAEKVRYFLHIIAPDPSVDHKLVVVTPNADVTYFLRVLDPEGKELAPQHSESTKGHSAKVKAHLGGPPRLSSVRVSSPSEPD
jgi:hypothetical protein